MNMVENDVGRSRKVCLVGLRVYLLSTLICFLRNLVPIWLSILFWSPSCRFCVFLSSIRRWRCLWISLFPSQTASLQSSLDIRSGYVWTCSSLTWSLILCRFLKTLHEQRIPMLNLSTSNSKKAPHCLCHKLQPFFYLFQWSCSL